MINTNEKLLDILTDSQYFLLSKMVKYGKQSCPKNDVLCKATKWGLKKVLKVKKELVKVGVLRVEKRWQIVNNKKVRDSNKYVVTTDLIAKYRPKKKTGDISLFELVQSELSQSELVQSDIVQNDLGIIKVLKVLIIESNKLLKEKEGKTPLVFDDKMKYILEFQKIKNGEQTSKTQLDQYFHFGLFPDNWTDDFKNSVLGMWRYLEKKEDKPYYWGNLGTITTQIDVLKSSLNEYSEQQIIKSFQACKLASKKSWNLYLKNIAAKKSGNQYHGEKGTYSLGQKITNG